MSALLVWDGIGERTYETGVDHGVLYPAVDGMYPKGVVWNGLTAVTESPSGGEDSALYADNIKYLNLKSAEEFGASIECYTYPDEWMACDGSAELANGVVLGGQKRQNFGLSYRTKIGNDVDGEDHGYKLHLIYNCSATPSERAYNTVNDSPEAITFSYEISTTPITMENFKPVSCITIDSTKADKAKLASLEEILYGTAGVYTETTDDTYQAEKTYYTLNANGVYIKFTGTSFSDGVTYYEETTAPIDARLPLPAEIAKIFAAG